MNKFLIGLLIVVLAIGGFFYNRFYGSTTAFSSKSKTLYIPSSGIEKSELLAKLKADSITRYPNSFEWAANKKKYFDQIKPGKYRIPEGTSIIALINMLKLGLQEPANLVIGKIRTQEQLAKRISNYIETDSATVFQYLSNPSNLAKLGVNEDTWMTLLIQNTYSILWTHTPEQVMLRLQKEKDKFWSQQNRTELLKTIGYSQNQVYTIASIVDEESNKVDERPTIASVYLNRLRTGMPLQADPTVRFGLKAFTANRITYDMLRTPTPYNTYVHSGLPPGPICVPSISSIDAVLNAPKTDYLYFVAKPNFSGYHDFNSDYQAHTRAANIYQDSLTAWLKRKAAKERAKADSLAKLAR